jgi:four helix bundle protein
LVPCWVLGAGCGTLFATPVFMGVRRYQDLDAWRLANELKREVYALGPANLAEGFGCYRHPEFARYVRVARASLLETHNHLGDGVDRRFWSAEEATRLQTLADKAMGATTRLMRYLMSTKAPSTKHGTQHVAPSTLHKLRSP